MGFDQKGSTVFKVSLGENNKWNVNETGFDKALASFDTETDAHSYAQGLARIKQNATVESGGKVLS